jgi:hypothetical protein
MKFIFPVIRFGLIIGIGNGVPRKEADIRLGNIIIN